MATVLLCNVSTTDTMLFCLSYLTQAVKRDKACVARFAIAYDILRQKCG
jgi:hypothetical protein